MENFSAEVRHCLERLDTERLRKIWHHVSPHLPQPESNDGMLVAIHHARTQSKSVEFKLRAYSHSWLAERGFHSGLPDELKPSAERMYPRIVGVVGISVQSRSELFRPIAQKVERAMSDAVIEAYSDNKIEPEFVKARMNEAREKIKAAYL